MSESSFLTNKYIAAWGRFTPAIIRDLITTADSQILTSTTSHSVIAGIATHNGTTEVEMRHAIEKQRLERIKQGVPPMRQTLVMETTYDDIRNASVALGRRKPKEPKERKRQAIAQTSSTQALVFEPGRNSSGQTHPQLEGGDQVVGSQHRGVGSDSPYIPRLEEESVGSSNRDLRTTTSFVGTSSGPVSDHYTQQPPLMLPSLGPYGGPPNPPPFGAVDPNFPPLLAPQINRRSSFDKSTLKRLPGPTPEGKLHPKIP